MVIIILAAILLLLFLSSVVAVFKDVAVKILFWLYMAVALFGIGYSMSIVVKDVFYFTSYDILRIIMSLAVLIIPTILIIKQIRKKWIRGLLFVLQMVVLYFSLGCIFLSIVPRPLSKTAIEEQILVQMPKYKITKFSLTYYRIFQSDCEGEQILKYKGDRTEFYRDLDSLSRVEGTGWSKIDNHYEFSSWKMDEEHFDRAEYSYGFFTMKTSEAENKAYIEFWDI